ncbi:MAG: hypothetical protein JO273_22380 [Methylobacteriaceae bacterium]|nr:hypothetical protein [Methylobacteriaceae bacterium]
MNETLRALGGQPGSILPALVVYRDMLTERFLRPGARSSPFRVLGIAVPHMPADGLVGFGVGQADDGYPPCLVIFAESPTAAVASLHGRLGENGIPVIVQIGVSFAAAARPLKGGQSIGRGAKTGESGTMGCVVKDRSGGSLYALTCNHVIADLNGATKGSSEVWAPGAKHAGTAKDRLGVVHDFADIDFTAGAYNVIDAALAKPDSSGQIDRAIDQIGIPSGTNLALTFGDAVKKTGIASGHSTGKYRFQINAQITYGNGSKALFRDMLGIVGTKKDKDFAAQGDSGAVVLDDADAVAGQVISVASGIDLTLASAIKPVLDHFQVDIA